MSKLFKNVLKQKLAFFNRVDLQIHHILSDLRYFHSFLMLTDIEQSLSSVLNLLWHNSQFEFLTLRLMLSHLMRHLSCTYFREPLQSQGIISLFLLFSSSRKQILHSLLLILKYIIFLSFDALKQGVLGFWGFGVLGFWVLGLRFGFRVGV